MSDEEFQYRCSPDRSLNGCGATPRVGTEAIPPELQSLEAALAALRPATPRLDRDRVMFVAGQASVTPRSRSWTQTAWRHAVPMAAAAAAAVLVTVWVWQPERQIVERLVYVPGPRPPIAAAEEPAAGVPEVVPESPAGGPAPIASIAPDRSLGLPIWLASWMGMELDDGNRLPWRRALTEEQEAPLWAHSGSPRYPESALPDPSDSHPASPGSSKSVPTMSRQSLDRLLDDLTAAGRLAPWIPAGSRAPNATPWA